MLNDIKYQIRSKYQNKLYPSAASSSKTVIIMNFPKTSGRIIFLTGKEVTPRKIEIESLGSGSIEHKKLTK